MRLKLNIKGLREMELCEHGNTFNCLQCEVKYLKYVIEEQQKEIDSLTLDKCYLLEENKKLKEIYEGAYTDVYNENQKLIDKNYTLKK
jgi:hypothetical protein